MGKVSQIDKNPKSQIRSLKLLQHLLNVGFILSFDPFYGIALIRSRYCQ